MAKLTFKTRGMSSPQGKPKVYFTCHPLDFKAYFETISEEILKSQNCAVWYDEELMAQIEREGNGAAPGVPGSGLQPDDPSDILADLSDMQLIVIPVTSRFLYQDCRARTVEFAYAVEHHIPVLPLMQERDMESEFNRICGDLQFLDRNNCDNTTDSYEEKLQRFLSSVLVDDETAAKVRAAFDAYVFLSYRKKDRKFAKDLMRLIHSNEFCRDIAIWYDEYLTPGENFNDAISDAMEKSALFTLMVTPNLVNETNYVMNVEYPAARNAGKPVLPVEVEETSEEALKESYEGIPDCVKSQDQEELARRLAEHLKDIAIRENDADPRHLFFIGLAYLAGIDVEVDFERARAMITTAAEAGIEEAIEKLVSMYRSGEGVARDYLEAIRWQERLVEARRKKYGVSGSEADGRGLYLAQWTLGNFWYELQKFTEAERWYAIMRRTAEELLQQFPTVWARRDLSVSYDKLGEVSLAEGNLGAAKSYYEKALEIRWQLAEETGTVEARIDVSVSYDMLGDISFAEGNFWAAKSYHVKALKISEQLAEEAGTVWARRNLSVYYDKVGTIRRVEGNLGAAKSYYEKALEIREKLSEETGTVESRCDLSISYNNMGYIFKVEGNLSEAKAYYAKALEISEQLNEDTGTVWACSNLASSYHCLGDISLAEGNLGAAKSYYEKALEIRWQLAEETGTVETRRFLSISYISLGDISLAEGNFGAVKSYYEKALEIRWQLAEETGTVNAREDLSVSYDKLGEVSLAEGNLGAAKSYREKASEIHTQLVVEIGTVKARRDLSVNYERLDDVSLADGSLRAAKFYYEKALGIRERLSEETGYEDSGYIHLEAGDRSHAAECFGRELKLYAALSERSENAQYDKELVRCCNGLWSIFGEENTEEFRRYCEPALPAIEAAVERCSDWDLAYDLAILCSRMEEWKKAQNAYIKATGFIDWDTKEPEELRKLIDCFEQAGSAYKEMEDYTHAETCYEEAKDYREKLLELCPTVEERFGLIREYRNIIDCYVELEWESETAENGEAAILLARELARETNAPEHREICGEIGYYLLFVTEGEEQVRLYEECLGIFERLAAEYPDTERYARIRDLVAKWDL